MEIKEEKDLSEEDLMESIKSLTVELNEVIKTVKNEYLSAEELEELEGVDFIQNVDEEIENDITECGEMSQDGKRMLWKYKDFQSEEDLNRWLKVFSDSIVEIRPSVYERLGFYVKLATNYI